jgi:hypothetical protein
MGRLIYWASVAVVMIRACGRNSEPLEVFVSQVVDVSQSRSGVVSVEDVRVVDRTTTRYSLGGAREMTSWACVSYVVANRTNGDIYVIDENSRHDGLRAGILTHARTNSATHPS